PPETGQPAYAPCGAAPRPSLVPSPLSHYSGSSISLPLANFRIATTETKPFMDLVGQVMAKPEHTNAPRVFVIVDHGPDHPGNAGADRLRKAHPNAIMIHTPVHASWLNHPEEGRHA